MIFYFTGTGNSLYAAQKLADEGEKIISIVDALRSKAFHYTLNAGEKLGFVFPVYFYTVSDPVLELVRKLMQKALIHQRRHGHRVVYEQVAVSAGQLFVAIPIDKFDLTHMAGRAKPLFQKLAEPVRIGQIIIIIQNDG